MRKTKFLPHDKYILVNDNDPSLKPICISLPDPPDLRLIDGYNLPIEEQKFKRLDIPEGLKRLEREAVFSLNEAVSKNAKKVVTVYRIQQKFWQLLEEQADKYQAEINFIRRVWWHRIHGYWFFNRGKPTYITGWHFMYLNFWTMDTDNGENRPDYRDRNRKEYLFKQYVYTATETFKRLDEAGNAIANDDGSYDMIDIGRRVFYGVGQSKNRRGGNTNMGLSDGTELVTRTERMDGMMIFSYTGKNAEEHFSTKMMPSFDDMPLWLKPLTTSGRDSVDINFTPSKNDYSAVGLRTKITAASTGGDKAADGKKLIYALMDEEGKTLEYNVSKRWGVVKQCLSQGNGRIIHGWAYHPSTVEEMTEGGSAYRILLSESNFYNRLPSGQTKSGLVRLFVPASEGLDGFIDPYGISIKDHIEDYQKELGFNETAQYFLQNERDSFLADGSPEAMASYRQHKKQFPLKYDDSWLGEAGDIGFPLEKIDARQAELRKTKLIKKGDLKWVDNVFGRDVYFEENEESGRFEMSIFPPENIRNQRSVVDGYSVFENKIVKMFKPKFTTYSVLGADPFKFKNQQQSMITKIATGKQGKQSNGGIAVLLNKFDEDTGSMSEWKGYRFMLSYSYRSFSEDFNEDVLKAAIYCCSMVYPETNVGSVDEYFIKNGFGGYLLYDIDKSTGKQKPRAGVHNIDSSKQTLFSLTKEYLEHRTLVECHSSYLSECARIKGLEQMTAFDRFAAHGLALMGAQSLYPKKIENASEGAFEMDDFVELFYY